MPKVKMEIEVEQKRPKDATPERALNMRGMGIKVTEIATLWNIKPARVYQLIQKAKKAQEKVRAGG